MSFQISKQDTTGTESPGMEPEMQLETDRPGFGSGPTRRPRATRAWLILAAAMLLAAAAPFGHPGPAAAQQPKRADPVAGKAPVCEPSATYEKKPDEAPTTRVGMSRFCLNNCAGPDKSNNESAGRCVDAWKTWFDADRETKARTPVADDVAKEKGVCRPWRAEANFYTSTTGKATIFDEIKDKLTIATTNLDKDATKDVGEYAESNFGPRGNKRAQETGRDSIKAYLRGVRHSFERDMRSYALLKDEDCFDCVAIERWAILKSAANMLAYSYSRFGNGAHVGLGKRHTLDQTKDDNTATPWLESGERRDIAKADDNPVYRDYGGPSIDLEKVTDQFVLALSQTLIKDMRDQICALVNDPTSNAYNKAETYFSRARQLQNRINRAFRDIEFKSGASTEEFLNAAQSEKLVQGDKKRSIKSVVDQLRNTPKRCQNSGMDLRPYSIDVGFPDELNPQPGWCRSDYMASAFVKPAGN